MRIIINECKKILDIRIILLLCMFSILYYMTFTQIYRYPTGGQLTNTKYDIPFTAELVKEWGPKWKVKDEKQYQEKHQELERGFAKIIKQDQELSKRGIVDYEIFNKKYEELGQKTTLSKQEKELDKILENYVFYNEKTSKIFLDIQALEHIKEFQGSEYGVSDKKYKELKADGFFDGTKLYQKAIEKRVKRDYISLVHEGVFYILQEDMVTIGGLIMICFFALIIPYQVKQRLRQIIPILATTKTGRRIYQIQLIASAFAALFVGILQMAVYGIIWHLKGLSVFWRCESWGIASNSYWCDKLSFGTYMLFYMALILLFAIASVVIIDFIGRTIGNYMGAVAVSIPVCGVMMFLMRKIYYMLFLITNDQVLAYWELYALATWLIVMFLFYKIRSKRWKKVDL